MACAGRRSLVFDRSATSPMLPPMHARRQTILLTGFGAFPGVPTNASAELVSRLAATATRRLAGYTVIGSILPTQWRDAPYYLMDLLESLDPTLVLHFGVSSRTAGFAVEVRGRNTCSQTVDALGEGPASSCVAAGGPEFLAATLPVQHIVTRLRRRGLPAQVSRDAGGYVCNALLYHSLQDARWRRGSRRTGFVHIPDALATRGGGPRRRSRSGSRLSLDEAVEGGLEIIAASLGRPALLL